MGAWIEIITVISQCRQGRVAPLVGAWIEMWYSLSFDKVRHRVAPLVGAWIEIIRSLIMVESSKVAPLVGAWIEIKIGRKK